MVCWISGSVCAGTARLPIALILPLLFARFSRCKRRSQTSPPADREAAGGRQERVCTQSVVPTRSGDISPSYRGAYELWSCMHIGENRLPRRCAPRNDRRGPLFCHCEPPAPWQSLAGTSDTVPFLSVIGCAYIVSNSILSILY